MANVKVSEMATATSFENDDYTMIVQSNKNKKITKQNMLGNIESNIGNLTSLTTNDKTSLVNAINENNAKIGNITGTILWTNPSPTSEFPAQTITLSSDDYDILEIFFQQSNNDTRQTSSSHILKGVNGRLIASYSGNLIVRNIDRNSDTSYSFSASSATGYETTSIIPIYIIGYKTGLFNV